MDDIEPGERADLQVISHASGERGVLKLTYAALIRATECWRGLGVTEFEQRQSSAIKDELVREFTAPPIRLSGRNWP